MTTRTVWKFKIDKNSCVEMPEGAQILYTKAKSSDMYIWALVNPNNPKTKVKLMIVETGEAFDESKKLEYIGTVSKNSGYRVHHIFKVIN